MGAEAWLDYGRGADERSGERLRVLSQEKRARSGLGGGSERERSIYELDGEDEEDDLD